MSESETDARTPQAAGLEVADAVVGSAETACGLRDERSGVSVETRSLVGERTGQQSGPDTLAWFSPSAGVAPAVWDYVRTHWSAMITGISAPARSIPSTSTSGPPIMAS
jgi:hypothetical protein